MRTGTGRSTLDGGEPARESPYWDFYREVAAAQLAEWLPAHPSRILDLSGAGCRWAMRMADLGHRVLVARPAGRPDQHRPGPPTAGRSGVIDRVVTDGPRLDWLVDAAVDAVLAEGRSLSLTLAAELTLEAISRVLRPGGRLLLCVDSSVLGLARLAGQGRWAELADVPAADVVLVPQPDGTLRRCFWPGELRACLTDAGLEVEWIRPRTVLSPEAVERALLAEPGRRPLLVATEVSLAAEREGDSIGAHLLASARRPA